MYDLMKRTIDFSVAALLLILCAPLLFVVAILIRWRMGPPVLFQQERPGRHGKPFQLYKFRTMTSERDVRGELLPDEDRLTPLGSWLRRTSLDELPQLFNVLTGRLSLVGPRPLLTEYLRHYSPEQARRHEVTPGVTGWAQINGRNAISWEEKFKLDIWYVEHRGLWLDVKILALTFLHVLQGRGIAAEGHATMPKFTGSGNA